MSLFIICFIMLHFRNQIEISGRILDEQLLHNRQVDGVLQRWMGLCLWWLLHCYWWKCCLQANGTQVQTLEKFMSLVYWVYLFFSGPMNCYSLQHQNHSSSLFFITWHLLTLWSLFIKNKIKYRKFWDVYFTLFTLLVGLILLSVLRTLLWNSYEIGYQIK